MGLGCPLLLGSSARRLRRCAATVTQYVNIVNITNEDGTSMYITSLVLVTTFTFGLSDLEGSTTIRTKDEFGPKTRFGPKTNSDPILKFGPNYFAN